MMEQSSEICMYERLISYIQTQFKKGAMGNAKP